MGRLRAREWGIGLFLFTLLIFFKSTVEIRLQSFRSGRPALKPLQAASQAKSLQRFSFGMDNLIAASLWVTLLQDASHEKLVDGTVSWEYAMLNSITTLDRPFLRAYDFGASFLSIFRQDREGAKLLLEKMVHQFPNHWQPHYLLAFHLYSELFNYPAAANEMMKASQMSGAPAYLAALGVGLLSESGSLHQALETALSIYPSIHHPEGRHRLDLRIRTLKFHLAKLSWEEASKKYVARLKKWPLTLEEIRPFLPNPTVQEEFEFIWDKEKNRISPSRDYGIEQLGIHHPKQT